MQCSWADACDTGTAWLLHGEPHGQTEQALSTFHLHGEGIFGSFGVACKIKLSSMGVVTGVVLINRTFRISEAQ